MAQLHHENRRSQLLATVILVTSDRVEFGEARF